MRRWRTLAAVLAVVAVLVLRHDFWHWNAVRPLLFGLLPVGLWWQVGVSLAACLTMVLLVRWAWPAWLEEGETDRGSSPVAQAPPRNERPPG
jgi:hypothetical protein